MTGGSKVRRRVRRRRVRIMMRVMMSVHGRCIENVRRAVRVQLSLQRIAAAVGADVVKRSWTLCDNRLVRDSVRTGRWSCGRLSAQADVSSGLRICVFGLNTGGGRSDPGAQCR